MKRYALSVLGGFVVTVVMAGNLSYAYADGVGTKVLSGRLDINIRQWEKIKDLTFALIASIELTVDASGKVTATVTPEGKASAVVFVGKDLAHLKPVLDAPSTVTGNGNVNGRAISLVFDVGSGFDLIGPNSGGLPDKLIFAVGASRDDFDEMPSGPITGLVGGSAATSDPGQIGDWGLIQILH